MDKNLKKLAKLQSVLDVYERQLNNLQSLGEQVSEDHKKIHFYVEHQDEINRRFEQMNAMPFPSQDDYKKPKAPDFEPFYMEMRDHYALHFIGIIMTGLKEQVELIEEKIKRLKEEIIKEN